MAASIWNPGSDSIVANAENGSLIQKFIATAGQTLFTLTSFSYVVDTGSIRVYRNGVKLQSSEVSETSDTTFTLIGIVLAAGEIIEASAVLGSQDAVTAAALSAATSAVSAAASASEAAASAATVLPVVDQIAAAAVKVPDDLDEFGFRDTIELTLKKCTLASIKGALNTIYMSIVAPGDAGNVLTSDGETWVSEAPAVDTSGRRLAQIVTYQTGAVATGTTVIPPDNSIPQNTEGDQYMSLAITPTNALSTLEVNVGVLCAHTVATSARICALFKDANASALVACLESVSGANYATTLNLSYQIMAGDTNAQTFKVRAGGSSAGTLTFNGASGGPLFGGVANSYITIKEYLP